MNTTRTTGLAEAVGEKCERGALGSAYPIMNAARTTRLAEGESSGQGADGPAYLSMNAANAVRMQATRKLVVTRINNRLGADRFLVAKREAREVPGMSVYPAARWSVSYRMATGDRRTAKYEVSGPAVDILELARELGVRLTAAEVQALSSPAQVAA